MNPMSNVKGILNMNQKELELGLSGTNTSWHSKYKDSAWIFVGGLPYDLTEGDTICVFSQYGEIVNINLVRDKQTGKSKGYCFICYEDQRSTILAVDNLNGIKVLGRTIRVDHVSNYKMPKEGKDEVLDDITKKLRLEGCAPQVAAPAGEEEEELELSAKKVKKDKKAKKKKKKEKKMKKEKKKKSSSDSDSESSTEEASQPSKIKTEIDGTKYPKVKKEKEDSVYEKYAQRGSKEKSPNRSRDHGSNIVPSSSTQKDNKQNRREDWERSQERNRDRGQERNRDRSQERNRERNPERNRDRSQERNRDRRYDSRSPDRCRDQNDNTTHRSRDRQTSRDREFRHQGNRSHDSNRHQDRSRDRSREQERGGSRDRSRDRGKGDRRREDGYRERSRSRERNYRR